MSQAKVDYHKEQKLNRKENVKKQKRVRVLRIVAGTLVALALVSWVGYSVYNKAEEKKAEEVNYLTLDSDALSDYMSNMGE